MNTVRTADAEGASGDHERREASASPGSSAARGYRRARPVVMFMAAGLAAVVLIGALAFGVARRIAVTEAVRDARDLTRVDARSVAAVLSDGVMAGDESALRRLNEGVRDRVLSQRVVRVKVWAADGRIVYSDDARLVGQRFTLDHKEVDVLQRAQVAAEVSDLAKPENRDERRYGKLLEVYLGTRSTSGTPLLFETYLRYDSVTANGRRLLAEFLPALVGGLVILWIVQLPLAIGLTRRISDGHRRERELLERAVESSDVERRRIAADLHDGVVQGLAGSSMKLSAAAVDLRRTGAYDPAVAIDVEAAQLRQLVRELRTLLVSIAPPKLHEEGLAAAVADLGSSARSRGLEVTIDVPADLALSRTAELLLFRAAREAVRNTIAHASASALELRVGRDGGEVTLTVDDDGVGFSSAVAASRGASGHVGLVLLEQLVVDAGGSLTVGSRRGGLRGTLLELRVPSR